MTDKSSWTSRIHQQDIKVQPDREQAPQDQDSKVPQDMVQPDNREQAPQDQDKVQPDREQAPKEQDNKDGESAIRDPATHPRQSQAQG